MSKAEKRDHIVAPPDCTGCSLCANVCGHDAIAMVWSEEGFLIPQVDEAACVGCGLCVLKCPALQERPKVQDELRESVPTFGAWHRDAEVHRASSSGGVFTALASWVLAQGGCVFGVVWRDKVTAVFTKAESMEEVALMRGSKYVPAVPGMSFREVKAELRKGRRVLFVGVPCQVHALRSYLGKRYDLLLTVDVVCHGVPSRLLWQKFVAEAEDRSGKVVRRVSFRDKDEGWLRYNLTTHFTDGSREAQFYFDTDFMRLFLSDVALNRCCYDCRYAGLPRQGDVTVGDFWGVQRLHPDWPLRDGVAAVLVNSPAGEAAMAAVADVLVCRRVPFHELYDGQDMLHDKGQHGMHPYRARVLKAARRMSLARLRRRFVETLLLGPLALRRDALLLRVLRRLRRMF
ncbi:MAG TPA: Coenzyme F420 hydrogenase/dehydrogenase, beta subunit C-terminal domain [Candidatus Akkermansia intestinavium]|nr:Coenzyme F420 hydrogenase/dehydrogenase, beta subunit C-terminal domain [Candidatus Akkermansia intestinavium]